VPYEEILTVLDTLGGPAVVLLTAPGSNVEGETSYCRME
jgi:hypothetical protein